MNEYIEFIVRVPKDDADSFIARFGRKNVKILGYLLGEEIVRCRDCGRYPEDCDWCDDENQSGFCAWGERRTNDN